MTSQATKRATTAIAVYFGLTLVISWVLYFLGGALDNEFPEGFRLFGSDRGIRYQFVLAMWGPGVAALLTSAIF